MSALPPRKIRDLPKAFILSQLESYYGVRPPADAVEEDYSLWECVETGLQFAWPMVPGNSVFYAWLAGFESYYPGVRWEYGEVKRLLESEGTGRGKDFTLMDVGCGKGDFLRGLPFIPADRKVALDFNEPAVEACRRQGFQSFCGTIETALAGGHLSPAQFPVVTAFHCLEHVTDPVGFVRSLVKVTKPGGRVFLSTPYSPMSFESDWFDILNHPPHHMTRWNLAAYQRLAAMLNLKMRYFIPPSAAFRRALNVFRLLRYGPHRAVGTARLLKDLPVHFRQFLLLYQAQRRRSPIGADLILVELTVS